MDPGAELDPCSECVLSLECVASSVLSEYVPTLKCVASSVWSSTGWSGPLVQSQNARRTREYWRTPYQSK